MAAVVVGGTKAYRRWICAASTFSSISFMTGAVPDRKASCRRVHSYPQLHPILWLYSRTIQHGAESLINL